ncbi:MAG: polysaccharide deacetylase family protein [Acaryochloridaceae cyanobacterium CSU_3_4]|nr:polysaccharide deacetylase family protein [Acaryochloridaceae cyanobacterium CSU_3_4]
MLGKSLRVRVAHRQYRWLLAMGLLLGISALVVQANLQRMLVADLPQNIKAEALRSPLPYTTSGFRRTLKRLNAPEGQQPHQNRLPTQFQGQIIRGVTLPSHQKVIALTFDDGPWPKTTATVLDILRHHNVKATFFVLGSNGVQYPDLLKRIAQEGHAIGNHTWNHGYHYHSPALAQREIQLTQQVIAKYTGLQTALFRPPGGYLKNGLVAHAHASQQATILWTVDDTYSGSVDKAVKNVLQHAKSGGIVLLHDGGGDRKLTIQALPHIIRKLQQQGYQLVTIPELLEMATTEKANS